VVDTLRIDLPGVKSAFAAAIYPPTYTIPNFFTYINVNLAAAWKGQDYDLANEVYTFEFEGFNLAVPVDVAIKDLGTVDCDSDYIKTRRGFIELIADPNTPITRIVITAKGSTGVVLGTKELIL